MTEIVELDVAQLAKMLRSGRVVVRYHEDQSTTTHGRYGAMDSIWAATEVEGVLVIARYSCAESTRHLDPEEESSRMYDRVEVEFSTGNRDEAYAGLLNEWAQWGGRQYVKAQLAWEGNNDFSARELRFINHLVLLRLTWFRALLKHRPFIRGGKPAAGSLKANALRELRQRFEGFYEECLIEAIETVSMK